MENKKVTEPVELLYYNDENECYEDENEEDDEELNTDFSEENKIYEDEKLYIELTDEIREFIERNGYELFQKLRSSSLEEFLN